MKEEAGKIMVGLYENHSAEEGDDGVLISMSALKEEGCDCEAKRWKGESSLYSKVQSSAKQSINWRMRLEELEREEGLRMATQGENNDEMGECLLSHSISRSKPPSEVVPGEGYKDSTQKLKAIKLCKKASTKRKNDARKGE
ncbi:hypothetical protein KI387_013708, partial [Taxus chinensis]